MLSISTCSLHQNSRFTLSGCSVYHKTWLAYLDLSDLSFEMFFIFFHVFFPLTLMLVTLFSVPVLPVALTVALGLLSVILLVTLFLIRRQRRTDKYKRYSQITKTAVHPPQFAVRSVQQPFAPAKDSRLSGRKAEKNISSEESLSPISSEEMYFDAQDSLEGRASRSVSSREPSPAPEEQDSDEGEMYPIDHIGRIWFNLEYDGSAESLAVSLVKARNLSCGDKAVKTCDPFVKLHILCPEEKHVAQSKCKRKTYRPNFDEMFYFNLPVSELQRCTLRLSVYDGYRASQQHIIGEVLFPLTELNRNKKIELWRDLQAIEEVRVLYIANNSNLSNLINA